jgi:hypothetical protein
VVLAAGVLRSLEPCSPSLREPGATELARPRLSDMVHRCRARKLPNWIWVLFVASLVLLPETSASASLWLEVEPRKAPPLGVVHARTIGSGAVLAATDSQLDVYLAPVKAGQIDDLLSEDLTPIGQMVVDSNGDGTIDFQVPQLPAGKYEVILWCPPCAKYSAGRKLLVAGTFRVTEPAAVPRSGPAAPASVASTSRTPWVLVLSVGVLGALLLLLARAALTNRLHR